MKKTILAVLAVLAMNSNAAYMTLIDCHFEYNADLGRNVYVGTYRSSMSNNIYRFIFNSYCPWSVNM